MRTKTFTQCGDCNRLMEEGETLYNIGQGRGVWVCEDCLRSTINDVDLGRWEQIKQDTPKREV